MIGHSCDIAGNRIGGRKFAQCGQLSAQLLNSIYTDIASVASVKRGALAPRFFQLEYEKAGRKFRRPSDLPNTTDSFQKA